MKTIQNVPALFDPAADAALTMPYSIPSRTSRGLAAGPFGPAPEKDLRRPGQPGPGSAIGKKKPVASDRSAPVRSAARKSPQPAQFVERTYESDAGKRDYMLFIPTDFDHQPMPLIVMLHGCKQDPQDFAAGTRMNQLAEESGCLVVFPAQASSANGFRCWNWFNTGDQQRDSGEPAIIAGITTQVMADYRVDPDRVFIAGLSAGGAMAVIMGRSYPELYAAVGVHSGLAYGRAQDVFSGLLAMRHGRQFAIRSTDAGTPSDSSAPPISTIVFHGDMDKTVHPDNGDHVIASSTLGAEPGEPAIALEINTSHAQIEDGHAYTQTCYLDDSGTAVAEQWIIHGAGHSWSGGDAAGSFTDPLGPDASREMLRFFLSQPRSPHTTVVQQEKARLWQAAKPTASS